MSAESKNKQCQICKGYLFSDDDVVVCPVCGAPHHRDCWQTVGHCGVEHAHGTEEQYDKKIQSESESSGSEQKTYKDNENGFVCPKCKRVTEAPKQNFCPYCGYSFNTSNTNGQFYSMPINPFDIYGGLPKDTTIDGVKVEDIATFVGSNSARYINRFSALNKRKKGSWNWAAFLLPSGWCLSRKMIPLGIMFIILSVASAICYMPFNEIWLELTGDQALTSFEAYRFVEENIGKFDLASLLFAFLGLVLDLVPRLICGRFGDWYYKNFAIEKIKTINADDNVDDKKTKLQLSGNVNLFFLLLAILATRFLPAIVMSLI